MSEPNATRSDAVPADPAYSVEPVRTRLAELVPEVRVAERVVVINALPGLLVESSLEEE